MQGMINDAKLGNWARRAQNFRIFIGLTFILLLTESFKANKCPGLNVGTEDDYFDMIRNGRYQPGWDPETDDLRVIKSKDSQYFYIKYKGLYLDKVNL